MVMTVENQIYAFLVTVYGGLIIGFVYNIYKVLRNIFKVKKFLSDISDILFWTVSTIIIIYFLYLSNYIEIRFYVFLGFMTGILIYNYLFSEFVTKLLLKLYNILVKFVKILLYPLLYILVMFKKQFGFLNNNILRLKIYINNEIVKFKIFRSKK
ncbi:MAG: spore cortex biosynthesis protein YabQ [Thermoanaerobacteraceae bacterium]